MPSHSFVMPIQGVEASYANLMGLIALLYKKSGTPCIFEILRIRQHSKVKVDFLIGIFYKLMLYF
ncbi:hypothetical protein CHI06_19870 [Bacillus sp. 7884-1]|nr:hypothetical protein CHI06_19870 [Bacillus sp. 7884-1]